MKQTRLFILLLGMFAQLAPLLAQETGCVSGDCRNGKGYYYYPNGDKYIGEFSEGQRHGHGAYYFANGNVYKGEHHHNERHGYGTYKWKNGDVYVGEYQGNDRHGEGVYHFANGAKQEGVWKNGSFSHEKAVDLEPEVVVANATSKPTTTEPKPQAPTVYNTPTEEHTRSTDTRPRTALIIGNANYSEKPLQNPINDARSMAKSLNDLGFEVTLYVDATERQLKNAIRQYGNTLKERGGVGLFYYAGHGMQADGHNYLLPVDAKIQKENDVEFESVNLGRLLGELEYAENTLNILILDACRDNPFEAKFRSNGNGGLAPIYSMPVGTFIAYATAPGAVAFDGSTEHGLFTQELLEAIQQPNTKLEDVFKYVRKHVREKSGGRQIPWDNSSLEGDFYFRR